MMKNRLLKYSHSGKEFMKWKPKAKRFSSECSVRSCVFLTLNFVIVNVSEMRKTKKKNIVFYTIFFIVFLLTDFTLRYQTNRFECVNFRSSCHKQSRTCIEVISDFFRIFFPILHFSHRFWYNWLDDTRVCLQ